MLGFKVIISMQKVCEIPWNWASDIFQQRCNKDYIVSKETWLSSLIKQHKVMQSTSVRWPGGCVHTKINVREPRVHAKIDVGEPEHMQDELERLLETKYGILNKLLAAKLNPVFR